MKSLLFLFLVYLSVACCFFAPVESSAGSGLEPQVQQENNVCFLWAFGATVNSGSDQKLVPITRDTTLKTGDQLKIFVELKKKCYVYLLYYDSQGNFKMLFPYDIKEFTSDCKTSEEFFIPPGNFMFTLDENVGLETFHLLASADRLVQLERLIVEHVSGTLANKAESAKKILSQIRKIKKSNKKFSAVAERPVSIGGRLRAIDDEPDPLDVTTIAVEISAKIFYGRTFTVEHQ